MTHENPDLHLYLTLEESILILEALVERPFKLVFELIGKLNSQAQQFYCADSGRYEAQLFSLYPSEFTACIKALSDLPYARVQPLLANMNNQLQAQRLATTGLARERI